MSMQTSIVRGYGVDYSDLDNINTEKVLNFIKNHNSNLYENMMEAVIGCNDNYTEEDCVEWLMENMDRELIEEFEEWEYVRCAIIADIMRRETDISFEFLVGNDPIAYNQAILLPTLMPYQYSEKERVLTEEEMEEIFKKYFGELGIDVSPDIVDIFYYE